MPIITIHTNLPKETIPLGFEINLNKFLAPLFGKDLNRLVTSVFADQTIVTGDSEVAPMFIFRCWAFGVFGDIEKRNLCSIEIYKFLQLNFPQLTYQDIKVFLHDMPQVDYGPKPSK